MRGCYGKLFSVIQKPPKSSPNSDLLVFLNPSDLSHAHINQMAGDQTNLINKTTILFPGPHPRTTSLINAIGELMSVVDPDNKHEAQIVGSSI